MVAAVAAGNRDPARLHPGHWFLSLLVCGMACTMPGGQGEGRHGDDEEDEYDSEHNDRGGSAIVQMSVILHVHIRKEVRTMRIERRRSG